MQNQLSSYEHTDEIIEQILLTYKSITGLCSKYVPNNLNGANDITCRNSFYCEVIQKSIEGKNNCIKDLERSMKKVSHTLSPDVYICHGGLIVWTIPIIIGEKYIGIILSGHVRTSNNEYELEKLVELLSDKLRLAKAEINISILGTQVIKKGQISYTVELLFNLMRYYFDIEDNLSVLKFNGENLEVKLSNKTRNNSFNDKLLSGSLSERMDDPINRKSKHILKLSYIEQKDKEIITHINSGNRFLAKESFYELISDALKEANTNVMKAGIIGHLSHLTVSICKTMFYPKEIFLVYSNALENLQPLLDKSSIEKWINEIFDQLYMKYFLYKETLNDSVVDNVIKYIKQNYNKNLTIENIAKYIHISPYYMCRLFKKETGTTIKIFMMEYRLSVATKLLREEKFSISQISAEVGYNDVKSFSKAYKKKYGISPSKMKTDIQTLQI